MRYIDLDQDYYAICEWFRIRKMKPIKKKFLPKLGLIIEKRCAVFLYETNTPVCILENLISHPSCTSFDLDLLIDSAKVLAKDLGFELVIGATKLNQVIQRCEDLKFKKASGYTHLYCKL